MKALFLVIAMFTCSMAHAQSGQWDWVKQGKGSVLSSTNSPTGTSVCTDAANNVYVLGIYTDLLIMDTFQFTSSHNAYNMFLAKYDPAGNLLWTKATASPSGCFGSAIDVDASGNIYVGGNFIDSVNLGGIKLLSEGHGFPDIFIAKFDTQGNILWAKRAGGGGYDVIGAGSNIYPSGGLKLDNKGYIYIAGNIDSGFVNFDTTHINSKGTLFLAKYDTTGNVIWAKEANDSGNYHIIFDIAVDDLDNVFAIGLYGPGPIYFGAISLRSTSYSMFTAKYDHNGNLAWVNDTHSYEREGNRISSRGTIGYTLAVDKAGDVAVAGVTNGDSTIFGSMPVISDTGITKNGFIAKYSATGNTIWAKSMTQGQRIDNYPTHMSIDTNDDLYITGIFKGMCTFNSNTITSNGGYDIYACKYSITGNFKWLTSIGGSKDDIGFGITIDNVDNMYLTGNVVDTCTFGNYTISGTNSNMFVAKLTSPNTGVAQVLKTKSNISVYPNPAINTTTITTNTGNITTISIADDLGRIVYSQNLSQNSITVNTQNFVNGIYFVTCRTQQGERITQKLVVQR